jgi:hypothetical protein
MDHIHNETVLAFLKEHRDNPNVKDFLRRQGQVIRLINRESGTDYRDYLDYLEGNIGDDAEFTMAELEALLRPRFEVKLLKKEKKEFRYKDFDIAADELIKPVYIKDEGDFFTVWVREGRIDIPVRLLKKFVEFLKENGIPYQSEYDSWKERDLSARLVCHSQVARKYFI